MEVIPISECDVVADAVVCDPGAVEGCRCMLVDE